MRRSSVWYRSLTLFACLGALHSPAMAMAHGLAHQHVASDHDVSARHAPSTNIDGAAHDDSGEAAPGGEVNDASHPHNALHLRQGATPSPQGQLPAMPEQRPTEETPENAVIPVAAPIEAPTPSQLSPPEQPRAPPSR